MRSPGPMQWLVVAFYLWFCFTYFWTIDSPATLEKLRGYFQEMMVVWLVWEFAESPDDLRTLFRVSVAGSWVLSLLTLANFASPEAVAAGQIQWRWWAAAFCLPGDTRAGCSPGCLSSL